MLMNYTELVLVVTPARYSNSPSFNFENVVYKLPRQRSRELRSWLVKHFQLVLDPPGGDEYTDDDRLQAILLQSLSGQAHTLWNSVKRRPFLEVLGEVVFKDGQDRQIGSAQVLTAIRTDLASFPDFTMGTDVIVQQAPSSYSFPAAPQNSRYVLKMRSL